MSKELVMDLRVVALFIVALYCTAEVSAEVIYGVPRPDRDNGWVDMDDNGTLDFSFINVIQFPIIGQPDVFTFSVDPRSDFAP